MSFVSEFLKQAWFIDNDEQQYIVRDAPRNIMCRLKSIFKMLFHIKEYRYCLYPLFRNTGLCKNPDKKFLLKYILHLSIFLLKYILLPYINHKRSY